MNKKFRKLILPVSLLAALQSNALGLGSLQINSTLDEVLKGEIPFVVDSTEEIENIEVSVASSAEYKKVGLDKSYVPSNINVNILEKNGTKYIELSSKGPVSEPIVSLLLVVDWANGHLLREYTLLLDPPMFQNSQTSDYAETVQTNTYEAPAKIQSKTQPVSHLSVQSNNNFKSNSQVIVESGDTLWKIASRYNGDYNTPQQMMVAIFNSNPNAFQNDDMNRLRKGAVLTIPDSDQVSMVSNGQAISEVKSHTQNWSRMQTADDSYVSNDSPSSDYGIELIPPSDSDSSDSNNSSGSPSSARINTQTLADLNNAKEQLASSDLENSELSSRIAELEKIVEDQELAMSLKDTNLAQLQQQLSSEKVSETMGKEISTDDVWDSSKNSSDEMADTMESTDEMADTMESTDEMVDTVDSTDEMADTMDLTDEMADTMDSTDEMADNMDFTDSTGSVDSDNSIENVDEGIETDVVDQPVNIKPVKKELSWIDKLLEYKTWLIGLGALLIGLLGFLFMKGRGGNADSDGFLGSIESDDFNSPLDSDATELDLSNIDDIEDTLELDSNDESELTSEPEVVMMDDTDELDLDGGLTIEESSKELLAGNDLAAEELSLDFDLDINEDIESIEDTLEDNAEEAVKATEEEFENLEFDLSDDLFDTDDLELDLDDELSKKLDLEEENDLELELDDDLDLELDDDELDLELELGNEDELDLELSDDDELSIDLDVEEELGLVLDDENELDLELDDELDLELDDEDELDLELGDEVELDGADLGLELDNDKTELNLTALDTSDIDVGEDLNSDSIEFSTDEDVDIGLDLEDLSGDDAIDTKLDLAKAYYEMGDIDGAQQMVDEIIEEGNDEQKSMAEILKSEILGS